MKRALIVGGESTIGSSLRHTLQAMGWDVYATTRRKEAVSARMLFLDLARVTLPFAIKVDVVFLCASITSIAECQNKINEAKLINLDAQIMLADYFSSQGSHVIFLSTNAVFDGYKPYYRIHDHVNPVTVYGHNKATVEKQLMAMKGRISVLRLSKVLTIQMPLIKQWLETFNASQSIYAYDDLYVCPISLQMVVHSLKMIVEKKIYGLMHLSGEKDLSYYTLACDLADYFGFDRNSIKATSRKNDQMIASAQGPYTSLDMIEFMRLFELQDTSIQAVLKDCDLEALLSNTIN